MPPSRRKARSIALQTLYEVDLAGHPVETVLARLLEQKPLSDNALQYVQQLVRGVLENRARIDETITRFATAFPLDQLPAIDRNILRLAIYELLIDNMTPERVAINEAVELAKAFGSESSPRFVNGVLASICSQGSSAT